MAHVRDLGRLEEPSPLAGSGEEAESDVLGHRSDCAALAEWMQAHGLGAMGATM